MDELITGVLLILGLCGCIGIVERAYVSRMVSQWWSRLEATRVHLQIPRRPSRPKAEVIRYEQFHHRRVKGNV